MCRCCDNTANLHGACRVGLNGTCAQLLARASATCPGAAKPVAALSDARQLHHERRARSAGAVCTVPEPIFRNDGNVGEAQLRLAREAKHTPFLLPNTRWDTHQECRRASQKISSGQSSHTFTRHCHVCHMMVCGACIYCALSASVVILGTLIKSPSRCGTESRNPCAIGCTTGVSSRRSALSSASARSDGCTPETSMAFNCAKNSVTSSSFGPHASTCTAYCQWAHVRVTVLQDNVASKWLWLTDACVTLRFTCAPIVPQRRTYDREADAGYHNVVSESDSAHGKRLSLSKGPSSCISRHTLCVYRQAADMG